MLKYISIKNILALVPVICLALFNACDDDKEASATVELKSFGPAVLRGGELKFIGNNLNRVTAIVLPVDVEIAASAFTSQTSSLITLSVPEEAVEGLVVLKTPDGDITTKTPLTILEPITITAISPNPVKPGAKVTIAGTYLNLITSVEFGGLKKVTDFEAQSKTSLEVMVPVDAQSGSLLLLDNETIPNEIETEQILEVVTPAVTSISPNPVKAGAALTIKGTNLDLAVAVELAGNQRVESAAFTSVSPTKIVLNVPADTDDGVIKLVAASSVRTESADQLVMVVPTITGIEGLSANLAKNNNFITVTGTNLDLVTAVWFGGGKQGSIQAGGTATQISVKVPSDAQEGTVGFSTAANKSVDSPDELALVKPVITSFNPMTVETEDAPSITINGTDLDLVSKVIFGGGWEATVVSATATEIQIGVVPGSVTGAFKLITTNNTEVESADPLTIIPDVPDVDGPTEAFIDGFITITGTNLDVPADVIFPGNIKATVFGAKTATTVEVYVPANVAIGVGKIKFVTFKQEIYETPEINFKVAGVEPIVDPSLIINDFDESGHDLGWDNWGGNVEMGSDPAVGLSGKYLHGTNANTTAWTWIWGCNHSQLPKASVTTADHLFKLDVKITKPIPADANFEMEFNGTRIPLGNLGGSTPNGTWITITYDLSTFGNLPATITADGEWGMNLGSGTADITGLYIDNIRFQAK